MKILRVAPAIIFLLNFAAFPITAQNTNRPVVIVGKPTPFPTATPQPQPTAVPTTMPTPGVKPAPTGGLVDLQSRIRLVLSRPEIRRGNVGVKVVALDSGRVLFEENAEKYFMPASNMKVFTVAAAIERLTPDFRFLTTVFANSKPDSSGNIKGDLMIYGRGDISISTSFYERDYFRGLDLLADRIAASGLKRVEGDLVGDESYFTGEVVPYGWEWDDMQWYYGAEVSALPINDNAVDLSVQPAKAGLPCIVNILPSSIVFRIVNTCRTSDAKEKRDLTVKKDLDQNVLTISGTMPAGGAAFREPVSVSRPAELFVALLKQRLELKGITFAGRSRVIGAKDKTMLAVASSVPPVEIARFESPALGLIAAKTLKPSQNMYTETLLWTLGQEVRDSRMINWGPADKNPFLNPKSTSSDRGVFVVKQFLNEIGVAPDGIIQYDGSGLSRHNLVTPSALVQVYRYMGIQSRNSAVWMSAQPVAAVDGTLRNRFKGTRAAGNVRAKTGTIDQVSALSGYVTTAAGERLVFSVIVNGVSGGSARTSVIDEIVSQLAAFGGTTGDSMN